MFSMPPKLAYIGYLLLLGSEPTIIDPADSHLLLAVDGTTHTELFSSQGGGAGADNWAMTWTQTDRQLTVWGDGKVSTPLISFGISEIASSTVVTRADQFKPQFNGHDKGDCDFNNPPSQWPKNLATLSAGSGCAKSYSLLAVNRNGVETFYLWLTPQSGAMGYHHATLFSALSPRGPWSRQITVDGARSGLVQPVALQAGPGYTDRIGGKEFEFIYVYWLLHDPRPARPGTGGLSIHGADGRPGKIYLTRVPRDRYVDPGAYTIYNHDGSWRAINLATDVALAKSGDSVFHSAEGVGWTYSVNYLEDLDRYVLITEHAQTMRGNFGIYEADAPAGYRGQGRWKRIARKRNFAECFADGTAANAFYFTFSNKWSATDSDPESYQMVFTGIGDDDAYNHVKVTLQD